MWLPLKLPIKSLCSWYEPIFTFFLGALVANVYSANLVDSLFGPSAQTIVVSSRRPAAEQIWKSNHAANIRKVFVAILKLPSSMIHCWGSASQISSMFRLLSRSARLRGGGCSQLSEQMAQKSESTRFASRPLATSAQKKGENWVAWFSGFQKSPFFFSSFLNLQQEDLNIPKRSKM